MRKTNCIRIRNMEDELIDTTGKDEKRFHRAVEREKRKQMVE